MRRRVFVLRLSSLQHGGRPVVESRKLNERAARARTCDFFFFPFPPRALSEHEPEYRPCTRPLYVNIAVYSASLFCQQRKVEPFSSSWGARVHDLKIDIGWTTGTVFSCLAERDGQYRLAALSRSRLVYANRTVSPRSLVISDIPGVTDRRA